MPSSLEVLHGESGNWREISKGLPGQGPKMLPQILPDGQRKLYTFECSEWDSYTTVSLYRWPQNVSEEELPLIPEFKLEKVSETTVLKGEAFQLYIKTSERLPRVLLRIIQT